MKEYHMECNFSTLPDLRNEILLSSPKKPQKQHG